VENLHGYDWEALREQYRPWLRHVGHRSDLNYVIGEMIAELNVGHAYIAGGDYDVPERPSVALPGAMFELDAGSDRYRIVKIFLGHNEEERYRAPLSEIGMDVAEGDYLLAIDGVELTGKDNPYAMLRHKSGHPVEFTVNSSPTTKVRESFEWPFIARLLWQQTTVGPPWGLAGAVTGSGLWQVGSAATGQQTWDDRGGLRGKAGSEGLHPESASGYPPTKPIPFGEAEVRGASQAPSNYTASPDYRACNSIYIITQDNVPVNRLSLRHRSEIGKTGSTPQEVGAARTRRLLAVVVSAPTHQILNSHSLLTEILIRERFLELGVGRLPGSSGKALFPTSRGSSYTFYRFSQNFSNRIRRFFNTPTEFTALLHLLCHMWYNHRRNRQGRRLVTSAQREAPAPILDGHLPAIPLPEAWKGRPQ